MRKKTIILASSLALLLPTIQAEATQINTNQTSSQTETSPSSTQSSNNQTNDGQTSNNNNSNSQTNGTQTNDTQSTDTQNNEVNMLKQNLQDIETKKGNLQKQLSDIQQFIDSTEKTIMGIQSQLNDTNTQITDTVNKINNLTKSLDDNQKEIIAKTKELNEQKIKLGQTIAFLYENRNFGFFQFLFQTKDLSELLTINGFINIVADENDKLYKVIQEDEKLLAKQKEKLESDKNDLVASQSKLLVLKKQQEDQQAEQTAILNQHKDQEAQTISQINQEENASNQIMSQINLALRNTAPNSGSPDIPLNPNQKLAYPMKIGTYTITSLFGPRPQPTGGATTFHEGVDFGSSIGTPIYSCGTGTVIFSGPSEGYGNWIVIRNDNGLFTIYGHMYSNSILVKAGDRVKQGQQIASVGNAGISTGSHLHLSIATNFDGSKFTYIDPLTVLQ